MRRLYYLFPDVEHTQQIVDELLLKRINIKHIHTIARDGIHLGSLPEASLFQKFDLRHSFFVGLVAGVFLGIGMGIAFHTYLQIPLGGLMIATTFIGAILGAWASTMIGMMTPNIELKPFQPDIKEGKILLMVDIEKSRVDEIEDLVKQLHPEAAFSGAEPTIPPFP